MTVKLGPKKKGNELFRQEEQKTELALSASSRTTRVHCGPWWMRRMERLAVVKAIPCGGQQGCWKQGGCVWIDIPWVWEQSLYCFIPCPIWKPNKWKNNVSNDSMPSWWGHYDGRRFTQRETTVDSKQVLMQTAQSSSHYLSHKGTQGALDGRESHYRPS